MHGFPAYTKTYVSGLTGSGPDRDLLQHVRHFFRKGFVFSRCFWLTSPRRSGRGSEWGLPSRRDPAATARQLPLSHQGYREPDNEPAISPEQSCAKAPVGERDDCILIAKIVAKTVGAMRLEGASHYTSMEKIEIMLGPPLGLLVLGFMVVLITRKVRGF